MVPVDVTPLSGVANLVAGMKAAGYTDEQVRAELGTLALEFMRAQAPESRAYIVGMLRGFLAAVEAEGLA